MKYTFYPYYNNSMSMDDITEFIPKKIYNIPFLAVSLCRNIANKTKMLYRSQLLYTKMS